MPTLPAVEIPGFKEAIKRERGVRDLAFLDGNEIVGGVVVRQLSLRTMLLLEHSQNGFVIPFRFDDDVEVLSHAIQVLWFSQPGWKCPEVSERAMWRSWPDKVREALFQRRVLGRNPDPLKLVQEVREWIDESMMDCPHGSSADVQPPAYVSHPAHVLDLFAAAGLGFTYNEIMDMPLKRMWQHWRLAAHRIYDLKLTNPSDEVAVNFLGKGVAA